MNKRYLTFIGSYNTAMFLKCKRLPSIGETVIAEEFYQCGGGKAFNQSLAASKFGADVRFIGRIGNDEPGRNAFDVFKKSRIDTDYIINDENSRSGIGISFIDKSGSNMIAVAPGANYNLSTADIDLSERAIKESFITGFQLQNSIDTVFYGIKKTHSLGIKTFLDPSPITDIPEEILRCIDIIKPNEVEASKLSGVDVCDTDSAIAAGKWFLEKGIKNVVITLGSKGAVIVKEDFYKAFDAPEFDVKDTTGAGDVFIGTMLAKYSQGFSLEDSIPFAICSATLSTRNFGVMDSIPEKEEVDVFRRKFMNN